MKRLPPSKMTPKDFKFGGEGTRRKIQNFEERRSRRPPRVPIAHRREMRKGLNLQKLSEDGNPEPSVEPIRFKTGTPQSITYQDAHQGLDNAASASKISRREP